MDYPAEKNNFLVEHVLTIKNSYRQLLLKELIPNILSDEAFAHQLFMPLLPLLVMTPPVILFLITQTSKRWNCLS